MFEDDQQSRAVRIPLWRTRMGPADWTVGTIYLVISLANLACAGQLSFGTFLGWFWIWLVIGAPCLQLYLLPWSRSYIACATNVGWLLSALAVNAGMVSRTLPT